MNEKMLRRFSDWLFAHGSEVLATTNDYEVIRFTTQLGIAVLYRNKDGEITKGINGAQDAFNAFLDQRKWEGGGKRERRPRNARERNLLIRSIAERHVLRAGPDPRDGNRGTYRAACRKRAGQLAEPDPCLCLMQQ